jgi:hypothetical protein
MVKRPTDIIVETVSGPIRVIAVLLRALFLFAALLFFAVGAGIKSGLGLVDGVVFFGLACLITAGLKAGRRG